MNKNKNICATFSLIRKKKIKDIKKTELQNSFSQFYLFNKGFNLLILFLFNLKFSNNLIKIICIQNLQNGLKPIKVNSD